ncbi:MAG: TonB family protein [Candidatus Eisenbacteria bacterium]
MSNGFARHPRALLVVVALLAAGCGRARSDHAQRLAVPVEVLADTSGPSMRLTPTLPLPGAATGAAVWVARVSPSRPAPSEPPLPRPAPDTLETPPADPPTLAVDEDLKPPIPRDRARLTLPRGARPGSVELDVRVDEEGVVSDAMWAGGSSDSVLVQAAIACATGMRFVPAERAGRRVAVWCRQRFDFTRR